MDNDQNNLSCDKIQGMSQISVQVTDKLLWTRKEAAVMCGVCVSTFSKWVREGFMPQPLKKGRFSADAVRSVVSGAYNRNDNGDSAYDRWKACQ